MTRIEVWGNDRCENFAPGSSRCGPIDDSPAGCFSETSQLFSELFWTQKSCALEFGQVICLLMSSEEGASGGK